MKLGRLARNAAFLLTHTIHQKLIAPKRLMRWQAHSAPFVHTGARGVRMKLHPLQYIDERVYVDGAYEKRFLEFLRQRIKPGGVMLDVGANIGNHALYLNDLFDEVHCFEPNPKVAIRLEENIALNGASNLRVHRIGLGSSDAMIPFSSNENLALGKFLPEVQEDAVLLPVTIGDKWAAEARLKRVDYVKIDVEGFEAEVLIGLRESIRQFRPLVSFEYSGQAEDRASFESIREVLAGYEIYEPLLEPAASGTVGKVNFYLTHAIIPEIVSVTEPDERYYPYLLGIPTDRSERFDLT